MSHWDFGRPAGEQDAAAWPADSGWSADDGWLADEGWSADDGWIASEATGLYPITYERGTGPGPADPPGPAEQPLDDDFSDDDSDEDFDDDFDDYRGLGQSIRRWLLPVGITLAAAAAGAAFVLLTNSHPGPRARTGASAAPSMAPTGAPAPSSPASAAASAGPSGAPLTLAQARGVVSRYTQANNAANRQRSTALLAAAETGSSYAIDAGFYQEQLGAGAASYPAFAPVQVTYYIPRAEPAGEPRWFVVRVANAFDAKPGQVTSTEYLLFTRSASGVWRNAIEPYILEGASTPTVDLGADGFATEAPLSAASLAARPAQLPARTAAVLDGTASSAVVIPGQLSDQVEAQRWRARLPRATVTDTHSPATRTAGREFALRTSNGGALVFYTDTAQLAITAPAGTRFHLTVPGFYSADPGRTRAGLRYQEQFATYDPPAGGGAPTVVADWSGITGTS